MASARLPSEASTCLMKADQFSAEARPCLSSLKVYQRVKLARLASSRFDLGIHSRCRVPTSVFCAMTPVTSRHASSTDHLVLQPIKEINGKLKLPGSKSLSNRMLLLTALSEGTTVVENLLDSEDVRYMVAALKTLGLKVEEEWARNQATVVGCSGCFPVGSTNQNVELFLGNAGTAMRPLTAVVTAAGGRASYMLDGVPRMRERPIGDLVHGLKQLGADVDCILGTNCPPLRINAGGGLPGGKLGASVVEGLDYCIITPPKQLNVTSIDTYDDHRMAMAFSLAACANVPVTINDPGCTRKTFPDYFDVFRGLATLA